MLTEEYPLIYVLRRMSLLCFVFNVIWLQYSTAQHLQEFRIRGEIPAYDGKVYLFFEDNYKRKDKISADVMLGQLVWPLPEGTPAIESIVSKIQAQEF